MTTSPTSAALLAPPAFDLARFGDRTAVRTGSGDLTYRELAVRVDTLARRLGTERRLVLLPVRNDIESLVAYLAALAGRHPVLLTAPDGGLRTTDLVERFDPDIVLQPGPHGTRIDSRRAGSAHDLHPDLALLLSTSGSTGSPKLVRLSHENLVANARSIADYLGIRATDCAATTLPLHYCYGLSVVHSHLLRGAALLLTERSVVDECFWTEFTAASATTFAAVPYTVDLLDRSGFAARDLPSLRYLTQAGGRLAPERVRQLARLGQARGWDLVVMYGQTEATARMAYLPPHLTESHPHAIGRAVPGGSLTLRPVPGHDPDVGELVYRGANVMLGYAGSPADLALGRTVHELPTGDLARRTGDPGDGVFEVLGRLDRHAKLFGLRVDLDRVDRDLADQGLSTAVAARGDGLVVAVRVDEQQGQSSEAVLSRARRSAAASCGIPVGAVLAVAVRELPLTANGKPDHGAVAALGGLAVAEPTGVGAGGSTVSTDSLVALYAELLDKHDVTGNDSFVSLGGDSLSYVEMSVRLEDLLGDLPSDWHLARIADLAPVSRRRRGSAVDASVLLRALGIVLVVGTHANLFFLQGGAHLLLSVAGYNFARFPVAAPDRLARIRNVAGSLARIVVPASLWIGAVAVLTGMYRPVNVVMLNWLLGSRTWTVPWQFWFLEAIVWTTLAATALLSLPVVDRLERRAPFGTALAFLLATLAVRYAATGVEGSHAEWYTPTMVLWLFALGWAVAKATTGRRRAVVAAVAVVSVAGFFGDPVREAVVAGAVLLLIGLPQLRMPTLVVRAAAGLATISLYVYLTHWVVYPHLENRIPVLAVVLSFVVGAAYWALVSASRTAVARQIAHRRAPARGSRASGRPTQLSRS